MTDFETTSLEYANRNGPSFHQFILHIIQLFIDERVTNRADDIANRLNRDFSIVSPEWKTWVNKTAQYNATCELNRRFASSLF